MQHDASKQKWNSVSKSLNNRAKTTVSLQLHTLCFQSGMTTLVLGHIGPPFHPIITSISSCWWTHAMHCISANWLETKLDALCHKLATKLSWQHLRRSTFSSYSELFVESWQFYNPPHLHLVPVLGVTRDLRQQKTRGPGLSCGVVCMIPRSAISVEHQLVTYKQTDTAFFVVASFYPRQTSICHITMAYTMPAWHRTVKTDPWSQNSDSYGMVLGLERWGPKWPKSHMNVIPFKEHLHRHWQKCQQQQIRHIYASKTWYQRAE